MSIPRPWWEGVRGGGELLRKGFIANGKQAISPIDQAIHEYEDVLREMPDCVEAYLKLACAHAEKGILDAAIEDIKRYYPWNLTGWKPVST